MRGNEFKCSSFNVIKKYHWVIPHYVMCLKNIMKYILKYTNVFLAIKSSKLEGEPLPTNLRVSGVCTLYIKVAGSEIHRFLDRVFRSDHRDSEPLEAPLYAAVGRAVNA